MDVIYTRMFDILCHKMGFATDYFTFYFAELDMVCIVLRIVVFGYIYKSMIILLRIRKK